MVCISSWLIRLRFLLMFSLVYSHLNACGTPSKAKEDDKATPAVFNEIPSLLNYSIEDSACIAAPDTAGPTMLQYHAIEEGKLRTLVIRAVGFENNTSLRTNYIKETSFGMVTNKACAMDGSVSSCNDYSDIESQATPLKICEANAAYPRESVEGVAVTSLVHLNAVFRFYDSLPNKTISLPAVRLLVLPTFKTSFPSSSVVKSDNLAFYPRFDATPTIVVFPKGKIGQEIWPDTNLWESPWIMAHEGAHHIFRSYFKVVGTSYAHRSEDLTLLEQLNKTDTQALSLTGSSRTVSASDVISIFNEAFADLFAYLSLGADSRYIRGLACFSQVRDVGVGVFGDGSPKQLNNQPVLSSFFDKVHHESVDCDTPHFQDVHAIGAIVAYGLDQLFSKSLKAKKNLGSPSVRAAMMLDWVQEIGKRTSPVKGDTASLKGLLEAAIRVASTDGKTLSEDQCKTIRQVFVAFADEWLSGSNAPFYCSKDLP